jgi:stage V sporulation protein S
MRKREKRKKLTEYIIMNSQKKLSGFLIFERNFLRFGEYLFWKGILPLVFREEKEVSSMEVLKVSARSKPNSVAGALAGVLRERGSAEIQAIGAGALNQAVKAVAIARGFVAPSGIDLICIPAFTDVIIDGEERTAIKLIVEQR